jgi:hypothetical protein
MKPVEAAPELEEFLRRPENRAFLEFYEYWRRKAAGKALPSRADLDPLVGTRIAELEGEMTNKFLDEFIPDSAGTAMARHYEETAEGRISVRRETLRWHVRERQHVNYDVLLLPLSRDGTTIDMLFGYCVYYVK